ncbi:MAG: heavy metal-responsive transcriptional regulator [Dehalococcoidia bacterium]
MRIGELADRAGVSTKTIRYYEQIGLLPAPQRRASGYRAYTDEDVARLQFIGKAKLLDLSLGEVADILRASEPGSVNCEHVLSLLEGKRDQIDAWIREAQALRDALAHTIAAARSQIDSAPSGAYYCPIIERGLHERALHAEGRGHEQEREREPTAVAASGGAA